MTGFWGNNALNAFAPISNMNVGFSCGDGGGMRRRGEGAATHLFYEHMAIRGRVGECEIKYLPGCGGC